MRFKSIPSLEEIIVNLEVYHRDSSDDSAETMRGYEWTVKVIEVPKVWISHDDRVEFDKEEDWNAYNDEQDRRELQKEKEEEEEECYRRRRDPYWKNDSDYD